MNEAKIDEQNLTENFDINNTDFKEDLWKDEHEKILVEWADKAMCYRWLHSKSNSRYSIYNAWFTIPVIIMSTITGTANFAQDRFPPEHRTIVQVSIGSINILAGILTTIAQFLKISELNEAHRVSAISWDKFYRNIKVELAKSREDRMNVNQMLKMCKEEFDRLMETSPDIDQKVIELFQNTFYSAKSSVIKEVKNKKYESFEKVSKPEICDELVSTSEVIYKKVENEDENIKIEMARKNKQEIENFEKDIQTFIKTFNDIHNREPLYNEIIDNLSDKIPKSILNNVLHRLKTLKVIENV